MALSALLIFMAFPENDPLHERSLPELLKKGDPRAFAFCEQFDLDPREMVKGRKVWTAIGFLGFLWLSLAWFILFPGLIAAYSLHEGLSEAL